LFIAVSSRLASACGANANVSTLAANIIPIVSAPSGNSGHVVVPKVWIGKEAIVTLKVVKAKGDRNKVPLHSEKNPGNQIMMKMKTKSS
jgi:hypothetical protein